jgi:hypothetical protein
MRREEELEIIRREEKMNEQDLEAEEVIEIEGVILHADGANIVLLVEGDKTIDLEMDSEIFDQLRKAINRQYRRSLKAE